MFDILIRNGRVADGSGLPWIMADVGISDDRITAVARIGTATAKEIIDAAGKVVGPASSTHTSTAISRLADPVHEQGVRQGVTTHILGQDGVAFAPGSVETQEYMRQYTAGFNGNFPTPAAKADRDQVPLAVRWPVLDQRLHLIPNGNVRMEVMGLDPQADTGRAQEDARHRPRGHGAGSGGTFQRARLRAESSRRRG